MVDTAWIHDLKVADLKEELKKRSLPVSGKKAELVERLEAYVNENEASPDEQALAAERAVSPADKDSGDDDGKDKAEAIDEEGDKASTGNEAAAHVDGQAAEKDEGAEPQQEEQAAAVVKEQAEPADTETRADDAVPIKAGTVAATASGDVEAPAADADMPDQPAAAAGEAGAGEETLAAREVQQEKEEAGEQGKKASPAPAAEVDLDYGESDEEHQAAAQRHQQRRSGVGDDASKRRRSDAGASDEPGAAAEAVPRPTKMPRTASMGGKAERGEAVPPDQVPPAEQPASRALMITGFVRPFTERQVRELLGETGNVLALWMPSIKTHAYAIFGTKAEAEATRVATYQLQWPATNPKRLAPTFVPLAEAEKAIGTGAGNPDFRVARTDEDAEDVHMPTEDADAEQRPAGAPGPPERSGSGIDRSKREWNRDKVPLPPEGGPAVRDLRDLLSSRRGAPAGPAGAPGPDLRDQLDRDRSERGRLERERGGDRALNPGRERERERSPPRAREPVKTLDDLFKRTEAKPCIYWLPLTAEQVAAKKAKALAANPPATSVGENGRP